jgi:hypothetical protein
MGHKEVQLGDVEFTCLAREMDTIRYVLMTVMTMRGGVG